MTHEMAKTLARQIQNFCNEKTSCDRCPFKIKINISETGCKIGFPCDWFSGKHISRKETK